MILRSRLHPPSFFYRGLFILIFGVLLSANLRAIPEKDYGRNYTNSVAPFLASGKRISFPSADGQHSLSAVLFRHPQEKGLIVVLNGFSQSWLQYGELFHDLYAQGYSVISYDHRGQGLSPHLVPSNSQIGHVEHFSDYVADMDSFMEQVVRPLRSDSIADSNSPSQKLFLIAHSMGAAVAADYLEQHSKTPPFQAAVLCAPMLEINTAPYPAWFARLLVTLLKAVGLGRHYAPGKGDYNPSEPFAKNKVTHSLDRWLQDQSFKKANPQLVVGGPSIGWVEASLGETERLRAHLSEISVPTLILQAGEEELVMNRSETEASKIIPSGKLLSFPGAKHEILMEQDSIRNEALSAILRFFDQSQPQRL